MPIDYSDATVFAALDTCAFENGCVELIDAEPLAVAVDLADCDADFNGADLDRLTPAVARWQERARRDPRATH